MQEKTPTKTPLIVIAGPTGIGKSSMAMELSKEFDTELISADSRQIYKYFDIGTAKPDKNDQATVKHHLIDFVEPEYTFTVSEYVEKARLIIEDIYQRGKTPLLVGGTGLYIKALLEDFSIPKAKPEPELRDHFKKLAEEKGNSFLFQKALEIDPEAMSKIHENDLFRVIRVLEVFESTGEKISQQRSKSTEPIYKIAYFGLEVERELLYKRIALRVDQMIEQGLVYEVTTLGERFGLDLPLLKTINYGEIRDFLKGEHSLDEAIELMKKNTRNFAKRQLSWFRNDPNIKMINPLEYSIPQLKQMIEKLLEK